LGRQQKGRGINAWFCLRRDAPVALSPTNVALFKRKQALSLGHANAYSCPNADAASAKATCLLPIERQMWINTVSSYAQIETNLVLGKLGDDGTRSDYGGLDNCKRDFDFTRSSEC
jgi:hypothetical protein